MLAPASQTFPVSFCRDFGLTLSHLQLWTLDKYSLELRLWFQLLQWHKASSCRSHQWEQRKVIIDYWKRIMLAKGGPGRRKGKGADGSGARLLQWNSWGWGCRTPLRLSPTRGESWAYSCRGTCLSAQMSTPSHSIETWHLGNICPVLNMGSFSVLQKSSSVWSKHKWF